LKQLPKPDKIKNQVVEQIIYPFSKVVKSKIVEKKDAATSQETPRSSSRENTNEMTHSPVILALIASTNQNEHQKSIREEMMSKHLSNLQRILGPGGLIAKHLNGYELRPQQLQMAEAVASALRSNQHLIAEAGTGVGKSFAYLIPAIELALETDEPVVISTNTISLQEQLIHKDIPFLQEVLRPDHRKGLLVEK